MRRNKQAPPNVEALNPSSVTYINGLKNNRRDNPFTVVSAPKKTENPLLRYYLIQLTERLATEAKNGRLKGLGGFADYDEGYIYGLEGSYLEDPAAAVVPMKRLEKRVMDQIEQED